MDPPSRGGGPHVFRRRGAARVPIDAVKIEIATQAEAINDRIVRNDSQAYFKKFVTHELKRRLENAAR